MEIVDQFVSNLIYGIMLGAVYGLVTMGLNIIFGVLRIVNVGHGAFVMLGAYIAYWMFVLLGVNPIASLALALVVGFIVGLAVYYAVIRRLIGAPEMSTLLATFAIGILLEELAKLLWSPEYRGYAWSLGDVVLGATVLPITKLLAFTSAVVIAGLLYVFLYRTKVGYAIRAVVQDIEGSYVCGIDVERIFAYSFAIGIAITVVGGILVTLFIPVGINPYMGGEYTLKAFVIAVLGGLGSPWGAFVAGFIFGVIENAAVTIYGFLPGLAPLALSRFTAFALLLLLLLVKPTGLFGGK